MTYFLFIYIYIYIYWATHVIRLSYYLMLKYLSNKLCNHSQVKWNYSISGVLDPWIQQIWLNIMIVLRFNLTSLKESFNGLHYDLCVYFVFSLSKLRNTLFLLNLDIWLFKNLILDTGLHILNVFFSQLIQV